MLCVITGPMYSSKTDRLLFQLDQDKYSDYKIQLFKPKIDNRYSETEVVTHNKRSMTATIVENAEEIEKLMEEDTQVVGIDEIQFFNSGIIQICDNLRRNGKVVYAVGLDMDYKRKPFLFADGIKSMGELLAIADVVDKREARCQEKINSKVCGKLARYSKRISGNKELVEIGSEGKYIATCLEHHSIPNS